MRPTKINDRTVLYSPNDFSMFVAGMADNMETRIFNIHGEPLRYPCLIEVQDVDYSYETHVNIDLIFYYQQHVVCEGCGHETLVWPELHHEPAWNY